LAGSSRANLPAPAKFSPRIDTIGYRYDHTVVDNWALAKFKIREDEGSDTMAGLWRVYWIPILDLFFFAEQP
jgi:hypothetical protein